MTTGENMTCASTSRKKTSPCRCGNYTDFKIFLSFTRAEEMLSVSMRIGQSATWHNWLCILCQRCNEVLFLFSHISHTAEPSQQNFTQIRDEQPWRFWVVWQSKINCSNPPPSLSVCKLPPAFSFSFSFFDHECVILGVVTEIGRACLCVGALFLSCHYCPSDLWVACVFYHLLTFCGSNWWSMLRDEVVI